jgi:hypothetical protein
MNEREKAQSAQVVGALKQKRSTAKYSGKPACQN